MSKSVPIRTYHPNGKQAVFHADPSKYRLLLGAWGAGKSAAMIEEGKAMGTIDRQGALIVYFRKTGPALRDTTLEMFRSLMPSELIKKEKKAEGHEEIELYNGTRYWFRSLDDWRKLGSTSFDAIFVDEAEELAAADFRTLRGRLRGNVGPRRMVLATNPPNVDHWLFKEFVREPLEGSRVHHLSMLDNAEHLGWDYINDNIRNLSPREARKYVYGQWGFLGAGDPVYDNFSDELHVKKLKFIAQLPLLRGWDFGYRHPAVSYGQILPSGHANTLYETVRFNTDIDQMCRIVKEETASRFGLYVPVIDYVDIAGKFTNDMGTTSVGTLRSHGIYPRMRKLPLLKSVRGIRGLMATIANGRPLFQVDPVCKFLVEAYAGGYQWNPKKDEPLKDPESWYDDVADSNRYWLASLLMPVTSRWADRPAPLPQRVAV